MKSKFASIIISLIAAFALWSYVVTFVSPEAEDELCAEYIKSILEGHELQDFEQRVAKLRYHGGEHFFDENRQDIYPQEDFWMCTEYNRFSFVIRVDKDEKGYVTHRIDV